jgi:hypothetical protein
MSWILEASSHPSRTLKKRRDKTNYLDVKEKKEKTT